MLNAFGLASFTIASLSSAGAAHDLFLIPDQFVATRVGQQPIQASVGSSFPQPLTVVTADRVDRLFADGAGKPRLTIIGPGAKALNLQLTGANAGTVVAAIKSATATSNMPIELRSGGDPEGPVRIAFTSASMNTRTLADRLR
ncbi:MAG: hypothetical protein M3R03_08250 [Pseudomonadota bacterium]|nr:hypothetical protein [Pseudomonadota bacterium]